MLNKEQFFKWGIIKLPKLISKKVVSNIKKDILAELERLNLKNGSKLNSSKIQDLSAFQQTIRLGQMVRLEEKVDAIFSKELLDLMTSLQDKKLFRSEPHGQLLLSFPHKEEWSLKNLNWHLDLKVPKKDEVPGIQAFVLIDDLKEKSGATLALAGSHRVHYLKEAEGNAHTYLKRQKIEMRFDSQDVSGINVQVIEMIGGAGDVYFMDMRVLHSPSINSSRNIRMMATLRLVTGK